MSELETRWIRVPTRLAEEARKQREARELRVAAYNADGKQREAQARYRASGKGKSVVKPERPFVIWDGEQPRDTGYSLFGNSEGFEICHPFLTTEECLELIIDTEAEIPDAIHIGFGFNFDVSWILKDIGWTRLNRLKKTGRTFWRGYRIQHVPRKWFVVSYGGITAKIFEVFSFFNKRLPDTLAEWQIGPWADSITTSIPRQRPDVTIAEQNSQHGYPLKQVTSLSPIYSVPSLASARNMSERELVECMKWVRSEFMYSDMETIRIYMRLELKYTRLLMEKLRETFLAAGYLPDSWHGPGALARQAHKRHNVASARSVCPVEVRKAARHAFVGGRFTPRLCGHMKRRVYSYDRNSAYPYAMTFLPNLAKGSWRLTTNPREIREAVTGNKFGMFKIAYHYRAEVESAPDWEERVNRIAYGMFPLPRRNSHGGVGWPHRVTSWFWTPEARLVIDSEHAEFIAAWVFDEDDVTDRPFAWVPEYFRRRLLLKRLGNPAEYTFKIILNAGFGQCAQRVGWDQVNRKPPKSHQLEWAGYITSHCRAAMYEMVLLAGEENVISIDTDGLYTLEPIPVPDGVLGDELGQWKCEIYEDMVIWQSGMYGLKTKDCQVKSCWNHKGLASECGHEWSKAKTRGIPKGAYSPEDLIKAVENGRTEIDVMQNKFIGYGMALNGSFARLNTWVQEPFTFKLGGVSSLVHRERTCSHSCTGTIHKLQNNTFFFPTLDPESHPHFLPWEENHPDMIKAKDLGDDLTFFDAWNPDSEEDWSMPDESLDMVV